MHSLTTYIDETDPEELVNGLTALLKESGFEVLKVERHDFHPSGLTALWLLSESHLALHTFPERQTSYLELTSCVPEYLYNFAQLAASYPWFHPVNPHDLGVL